MNSSLRSARSEDYAVIVSWIPDAFACLRWAGPRLQFPFTSEELSARLAPPNGDSWSLVGDSGILQGFGQHWTLHPGAVHLGRIIVAPQFRGQGLGRVLCCQLIANAVAATGASAVTLRVFRDNQAAMALYESFGFSPVVAECTEDAMFMRLQVNRSPTGETGCER